MKAPSLQLPDAVRGRALALGPAGEQWLEHLDALVPGLAQRWGLRLGAVRSGGSEALVLDAEPAVGPPAILKIGLPGGTALDTEARVLNLAAGRGYARLLAFDRGHGALLVERLGPALATLRDCEGRWDEVASAALCEALGAAWHAAPGFTDLTDGAAKARWLVAFVREQWTGVGDRHPPSVADAAIRAAEARMQAHDPARAVLVHGDAHAGNALAPLGAQDAGGPFRFVDPDGLLAEPEYDLAIQAREWTDDAFAADPVAVHAARCAELAARTGTDAEAIEQWAIAERVSTALECRRIGLEAYGDRLLDAAGALLR